MALTAKFYSFEKRKNSTKQPSGASTDFTIALKGGSSFLTPTLLLEINTKPTFNYLEFEDRFYYVKDIVNVRNNLWEISCVEDVLATHKTAIGNSTAMIMYATGANGNIIDTRIPTTADVTIVNESSPINGFTILDDTSGAVIISVVGTGSFGTYLLKDSTSVRELLSNVTLYTSTTISDLVTGFRQMISDGQISQNIKSAIAIPLIWSPSGQASQLYLGDYPCTYANANPILAYNLAGEYILKGDANVTIPWGRTGWLRNAPYTEVYLYLPLIGTITLPTNDIINNASLDVEYSINVTSGDVSALISGHNDGRFIATASGNCSMSTPYGSSNINSQKVGGAVVTGAVGVLGALAASNPYTAVAALGGGLAASAGQMLNAWHGETVGGGGLGGGASHGLYKRVRCAVVRHSLTDTQANIDPILGKPVMAKHTINQANGSANFSGFVQTDGMCVNGIMTDTEYEQINNACNKGIYFE